jgi:hypothetical protein
MELIRFAHGARLGRGFYSGSICYTGPKKKTAE